MYARFICTPNIYMAINHVKRGRKTLRLNGFPVVNFKQHYIIKLESENQKSGLIILVLFHSACPYKNYCLKCFTELQTLCKFFFLLSNYLVCNFLNKSGIHCRS